MYYVIRGELFGLPHYAADIRDDGSVTRWLMTPVGGCCWTLADAAKRVQLASTYYGPGKFEVVALNDLSAAGEMDTVPDHGNWPSGRGC